MYASFEHEYANSLSKAGHKAASGLKELVEVLEEFNETAEILSDGRLVAEVEAAKAEAKQGKFVKYDDLLKA